MSPTPAFPAVLRSLVETSEPATALKEDSGPREAKPATAGRSFLGAATRGCVRDSQLCQAEPLAAATTTVTLPVAATQPEHPAAGTSTAPETTAEDLARVAAPESLARLSPAPALLDGLSTAPEAHCRPANGSHVSSRPTATADPTPGEEDAPSLLGPAAALAEHSTVPDADAPRNRWNLAAGPGLGCSAWPAPRQSSASETQPATAGAAPTSSLASPALGAFADTAENPEMARLQQPPAILRAPAAPPRNPSSPLPDSPQPATVPAPQECSLASPLLGVPANSGEGLSVARPQEPFAGLSAQPRPPSKHSLDPVSASPNTAPLSAETLSSAAPASLGQPALEQRPFAAGVNRALFQAATAESTRHSAATAIRSPLPAEALEPARHGAREICEPAAQSGGGKATELAFGARLVPTAGPLEAPAGDPPDPLPVPFTTPARSSAAAPPGSAVPEPASGAAMTPLEPVVGLTGDSAEESSSQPAPLEKGEAAALERFRKPETLAPSSWEASSASAARLSPDTVYAPAVRLDNASSQPEHSAAAEPRPAAAPERGAGAEQSKPPSAARNIQLDVNGGDRRVEVRLTERGGEVQVAVRTPDAHLASTLREDLPALSSRLAESGFRAETWHPASPGASSGVPSGPGEWHKLAEPSPGGTPQDPNGRSRQNGGQPNGDSQPRQPQTREPQPDRKDQRKDFAWLMSSLR